MNAQLSQAGMYSCTAQTVVDSASASAKLVVRGKMRHSSVLWLVSPDQFITRERKTLKERNTVDLRFGHPEITDFFFTTHFGRLSNKYNVGEQCGFPLM